MKNKKGKSFLGMLLLLIAIGVFGYFGYSTMNQIKLGLDLAGGVSITYQAKEENPSSEDMADTIYKLQQRVQNYSTEAEVYQEGNNRINVDIPGVSDANAILEELGKPGSLIFVDSEGNQILDGKQVASAKAGMTEDKATGSKAYVVSLTFTEEGKQAFAEATTNGVGKPIYIIYDNQIISAPTVREAITGGQCQIDGMADYEEANNLASTIRIGSLSLELEELRSNVVGAKLGQEAISTSLKAGLIGFAIVIVFMIAVYLLPGLAASLALCLYVGLILILFPLWLVLINSFKTLEEAGKNFFALPSRLNFDNYRELFANSNYWIFLRNSLKITVISIILILILVPSISYAIARNFNKKYYKTIYYYLLLGLFIPSQVVLLPVTKMMSKLNMLNHGGLILLYAAFSLTQGVFLFVNYIRGLPYEIEESAQIDGCSVFQTYVRIVLPLVKPMISTLLIMDVLWIWNDFMLPLLILNRTQEIWTLPLFQYNFKTEYSFNYTMAFTAYLLAMLPMLIIYCMGQKYIVKGLTAGSVKG